MLHFARRGTPFLSLIKTKKYCFSSETSQLLKHSYFNARSNLYLKRLLSSKSKGAGYNGANIIDANAGLRNDDGSILSNASLFLDEPIQNLGYSPPDLVIQSIQNFHLYTGCPYWATVILTALSVRMFLFPAQLHDMRHRDSERKNSLELAKDRLEQIEKFKYKREIGPNAADFFEGNQLLKRSVINGKMFYVRKILFAKSLIGTILQGIVFVTVTFGLRKIGLYFPEWEEGGIKWFTDLNASDATKRLPITAAFAYFVSILTQPKIDQSTKLMLAITSLGTFIVYFVFKDLSAGLLLYWAANNVCGAAINISLSFDSVRKSLGLMTLAELKAVAASILETHAATNRAISERETTGRAEEENNSALKALKDIAFLNKMHGAWGDKSKDSVVFQKYKNILDTYAKEVDRNSRR